MPQYRFGRTTDQAHVRLPAGTVEEEFGRRGFYGRASHLYRLRPPTDWTRIDGPLRPHALDLNLLAPGGDGDALLPHTGAGQRRRPGGRLAARRHAGALPARRRHGQRAVRPPWQRPAGERLRDAAVPARRLPRGPARHHVPRRCRRADLAAERRLGRRGRSTGPRPARPARPVGRIRAAPARGRPARRGRRLPRGRAPPRPADHDPLPEPPARRRRVEGRPRRLRPQRRPAAADQLVQLPRAPERPHDLRAR